MRGRFDSKRAKAAAKRSRATVGQYVGRPLPELLDDPEVFGPLFEAETWRGWKAFIRALFGAPLAAGELDAYRRHTGREKAPQGPSRESFAIVGRRGGKSRIAALVAVYLACFRDYRKILAPGEKAVVLCLAVDKEQAAVVLGYVKGLVAAVPMLRKHVVREAKDEVSFKGGTAIAVRTSSYRQVRGYTLAAAVCDELAFWQDDRSANPDAEVLAALRPGLATVDGSLLLCISTPYARRGEVWKAYDRHYGVDDAPVLVWKATSREMNTALDQGVVDQALEDDPDAAAAEYLAEFRRDVQAFLSPEVLDAVIVPGRHELMHHEAHRYIAFTDPSGGSQDSFTLAIAHLEQRDGKAVAVLDCVRERKPPFSPDAVVEEFAGVLKAYRLHTVAGDRYGGEWPRERFKKHGITYQVSEKVKSDIYKAVLPVLNSGRAELLEDRKLRAQFERLERRVARGGKDSVDHGPGGKDDIANAAAGAVWLASKGTVAADIPADALAKLNEGLGPPDDPWNPDDDPGDLEQVPPWKVY